MSKSSDFSAMGFSVGAGLCLLSVPWPTARRDGEMGTPVNMVMVLL